jgi:RecA-family ATPase
MARGNAMTDRDITEFPPPDPRLIGKVRQIKVEPKPPANGHDTAPESAAPLPFIDMATWDNEPPPDREWAVHNRIPLRQPTLLSGEGGVGKTILLLQLCAATVLARDWIGMLPEPGPAIYLGAEDEADELQRRLTDIVRHYGVPFSGVRDLHMISLAGQDATLGAPDRGGVIHPTPLFKRLREAACDIRPKVIGLDTSSDIFSGNENDRNQVGTFIGILRALAMDANAAVIVNSHPSLAGISSGSGLSGTTGWHNKVRSRAYFKSAATDGGDEAVSELRELQFLKNNYGPKGERILLRWKNGVFVPEPRIGSLDQQLADQRIDDVFLTLLGRFNQAGRNVSDKTGTTYAPKTFSLEQEARGLSSKALDAAMRRLFQSNKIHVQTDGPQSRQRTRLVIGAAP